MNTGILPPGGGCARRTKKTTAASTIRSRDEQGGFFERPGWNLSATAALQRPGRTNLAPWWPTHFRLILDQHRLNSKHWRRMEAEARLIALSIGDPDSKWVMLHVAAGYKRLAERAELLETDRGFDGASFGPEALRAMGETFDLAWSEIADNFRGNRAQTEPIRLKLANARLSVASEDSRDANVLKRAALQRMALDYGRF